MPPNPDVASSTLLLPGTQPISHSGGGGRHYLVGWHLPIHARTKSHAAVVRMQANLAKRWTSEFLLLFLTT